MAPIGVVRVDLEPVEELGDQTDLAVPRLVGLIDRHDQVEVLAVLPHVELLAEQDLARVLRAEQDRDSTEVVTLVVDVVDERLERRDAQTAGYEQHVVALHLLEREIRGRTVRAARRCRRTAWREARP